MSDGGAQRASLALGCKCGAELNGGAERKKSM
jgi:hypothetical protein